MNPDDPIHLPPSLQARVAHGDLLGTYWPSVIALVLVVALMGLLWWRRRRVPRGTRRRAWGTASIWSGTALLLVASLALGVNTWVGYIPSIESAHRWIQTRLADGPAPDPGVAAAAGDPVDHSGGRLTSAKHGYAYQVTIGSTSDEVPDSPGWVYLPPDYDRPGNDTRYPVVYALHGAPGTAADWFSAGLVDRTLDELITTGYMPPVIMVAPDLNAGSTAPVDSEPLDLPGGPQLERYVRQDVVTWADANLRTRPDAADRVLSGMSAGGFAALVGGLHHPEVFGGVVALLPYGAPYTESLTADPDAAADDTPTTILQRRTEPSTQPVFLGMGDSESPAAARAIERALRAGGQPTTLRIYAGLDHNWVGARAMMPYGLVWISDQMGWGAEGG